MSRRRATHEGLDDDHATAAVWAGMRLAAIEGIGRFGLRLWDNKQLSRPRDVLDPLAAREQAVVADAVEASWQHMDQETADELVSGKRHRLVSIGAFDPIVLPLEGDAVAAERDQAAVGDGDAVGVARQIGQHCCGTAERTL